MSGIAGVVNRAGESVDPVLIRRMTDYLAFRGPDAQHVWCEGSAALGHALFRVTPESVVEDQPLSLDGTVWITADARVDDQDELRRRLEACGQAFGATASDAELLLRAYRVWGVDCVEHLLGDFSFGIWDAGRRRLFCARDHFGVRPFFYAELGNTLVFSNALRCVRQHPGVGRQLDELSVGDFLLREACGAPTRTIFAAIRRLPPAHCLIWDEQGLRVRRYWTLPAEPTQYSREPAEYVERFKDLLARAIRDRVRVGPATVFMSGGLDSTTVAAMAKEVLPTEQGIPPVRAQTTVYERLIQDPERTTSRTAATALGIPHRQQAIDDYPPFPGWGGPHFTTPEPINSGLMQTLIEACRLVRQHGRLVLTGLGPDGTFMWSATYLPRLVEKFQFVRLAREVGSYWWTQGRFPSLGFRTLFRRWTGRKPKLAPPYPTWLNDAFAARLDLPARHQFLYAQEPTSGHPTRPEAYHCLIDPSWSLIFERYDAEQYGVPLELGHPFFDVRLVRYVLTLPPFPWCFHKTLLREAMRGKLPEAIRRRRKALFPMEPTLLALRLLDGTALERYNLHPGLEGFVERSRVPNLVRIRDEPKEIEARTNLRPYSLSYWLQEEFSD